MIWLNSGKGDLTLKDAYQYKAPLGQNFLVPWSIRNIWGNCLLKTSQMNFIVSHIYREENTCADLLANIGLTINDTMWWDNVPNAIKFDLVRNELGLPNYRFVNI